MTTNSTTTSKLPEHLFVSSCDGSLSDTRKAGWHKAPLRVNYSQTHRTIASLADVKATLRNGAFAWPGGYPLYFITRDGAALCFACTRKKFRQIVWDFMRDCSTGWRVEGCDINYEDAECYCAHCDRQIEPAYS